MAITKGTMALATFLGVLGLALYPIVISPMIDTSEYKKIQKITRQNIKQEDIQPGKALQQPWSRVDCNEYESLVGSFWT